jgi:hypothetical protein
MFLYLRHLADAALGALADLGGANPRVGRRPPTRSDAQSEPPETSHGRMKRNSSKIEQFEPAEDIEAALGLRDGFLASRRRSKEKRTDRAS